MSAIHQSSDRNTLSHHNRSKWDWLQMSCLLQFRAFPELNRRGGMSEADSADGGSKSRLTRALKKVSGTLRHLDSWECSDASKVPDTFFNTPLAAGRR